MQKISNLPPLIRCSFEYTEEVIAKFWTKDCWIGSPCVIIECLKLYMVMYKMHGHIENIGWKSCQECVRLPWKPMYIDFIDFDHQPCPWVSVYINWSSVGMRTKRWYLQVVYIYIKVIDDTQHQSSTYSRLSANYTCKDLLFSWYA